MAAHGTSRFFMILQSFPQKHLASSEEPLAQGAQILRLVVGWYLRGGPGYVETGGIFRSISLVTWYSKYVYSFVTSTGGYGADHHH